MKYLKFFEDSLENEHINNCTVNGVNYKVGDMVSINLELLKRYHPIAAKKSNQETKVNLTPYAEYEILYIKKIKKGLPRTKYRGIGSPEHYEIMIFNDVSEIMNIPLECVYKEIESSMVKYNL